MSCLALVLVLSVRCLWSVLTLLLALLAGREIFQMSVSLRRYILTFENWVEMTMVALVRYGTIWNLKSFEKFYYLSVLLFAPNEENMELKRHLAGICLLLSWGNHVKYS